MITSPEFSPSYFISCDAQLLFGNTNVCSYNEVKLFCCEETLWLQLRGSPCMHLACVCGHHSQTLRLKRPKLGMWSPSNWVRVNNDVCVVMGVVLS